MFGGLCNLCPFPQGRRARQESAFSLIEIALALGVVAFALVAILGMVPVAVDAASESRLETRATFIARSMIETLRAGARAEGLIEVTPEEFRPEAFPVGTDSTTLYLAYDNDGKMISEAVSYDYTDGGNIPMDAVFMVRLTLTGQGDNEPVHVEASVETPAVAAEENRKKFPFVTLIAP